jgi:hypothetical protein
MPTLYDADILQQFADDLYSRAKSIVITTAVTYAVLVFMAGAVLSSALKAGDVSLVYTLVATAIAGAIGARAGQVKAFKLKLEAQTRASCMEVLRQRAESTGPNPPPPPPRNAVSAGM